MTKISVIIPVYNVEEYLNQCIDSVLSQTLKDIEVICVDDNSSDRSLDILKEYQKNDGRMKVFHFDESKSALQARKLAVLNSTGKYIMFLDADDYLSSDACELLYKKMEDENVDILHFNSHVENCANIPQKRVDYNQKIIKPYLGRIDGTKVFEACFVEKKYMITLWNKLFNGDLVRKSFTEMVDRYLPKAQDLYSFYIISYNARSYCGWDSKPLHFYCFGRGVTGTQQMNLNKFERYNAQAYIVEELRSFNNKVNMEEKFAEVIKKYNDGWMNECIRLWENDLSYSNSEEGLEILCKYWGAENIVARLAQTHWEDKMTVAKRLKRLKRISLKEKQVKRIGIYYYHFTIGGVQRVISLLTPLLKQMGYEVVLIFDNEATDNDMILEDDGTRRLGIFNVKSVKADNYNKRIQSWKSIIHEYKLDVVLYNAWTSPVLLWDLLYLKSQNVSVFVHAHSVFSFSMNKLTKSFSEFPKIFRLADGMIVLSDVDKVFWSAYNKNVHSIPNPIDDSLRHTGTVKFSNKSIIWVGRVSEEKQPEAVFDIMEKVVKYVPDAHLYLLGNFDDSKWKEMAIEKKLTKNIEFCGMIHNVNDYFEKSSIYLSTSKYEGFAMTLLEAQAHSLPSVMFNMCNLTLAQEGHGVVSVGMSNCTNAADEIVKLLCDEELWNKYSQQAKESYQSLENFDYEAAWGNLLRGEVSHEELDLATRQMIRTIVNHYEEGINYRAKEEKRKKKRKIKKKGLVKVADLIERGIRYLKKNGVISSVNKFYRKSIKVIKRKLK